MSSHVHIGLYDALREAGASEEKALAALATLPLPQHLATKEDLLKAIGEVKTDLAVLKFAVFTFGAAIIGCSSSWFSSPNASSEAAELRASPLRSFPFLRAENPSLARLMAVRKPVANRIHTAIPFRNP